MSRFIDNSTKAAENRAFYQNNERGITENLVKALEPYNFQYFVSITGIAGPGNYVCVYADLGDLWVVCINHEFKVLWNHSCGGSELESYHRLERGYIKGEVRVPQKGEKTYSLTEGNGHIEEVNNYLVTINLGFLNTTFINVAELVWVESENRWEYGDMDRK